MTEPILGVSRSTPLLRFEAIFEHCTRSRGALSCCVEIRNHKVKWTGVKTFEGPATDERIPCVSILFQNALAQNVENGSISPKALLPRRGLIQKQMRMSDIYQFLRNDICRKRADGIKTVAGRLSFVDQPYRNALIPDIDVIGDENVEKRKSQVSTSRCAVRVCIRDSLHDFLGRLWTQLATVLA